MSALKGSSYSSQSGKPVSPCVSQILTAPHGFFGRSGGFSTGLFSSLQTSHGKGDDHEHVDRNRCLICAHFDLEPDKLLSPMQIHGAQIEFVSLDHLNSRDKIQADGLLTFEKNILLAIQTADCIPLLIEGVDRNGHKFVGAIHIGWRGFVAGIIETLLRKLELLEINLQDCCCAIGPCISQENYQVGAEFRNVVIKYDSELAAFFAHCSESKKSDHKYRFDLAGSCIYTLKKHGFQHIDALNVCTYKQETHFFSCRRASHRKEPTFGNQMSVIKI